MKTFDVSFSIDPILITRVISMIVVSTILLGIAAYFMCYVYGYQYAMGFVPLFDMDNENSIPTYLSSFNLLIVSGFLFLISVNKRAVLDRFWKHWAGLSLIFLFLSMDETASIHEHYGGFVKKLLSLSGPPHYAWSIGGLLLVAIFLFSYARFIFSLPTKTRLNFVCAGLVYTVGALGVEAISGYLFSFDSIYYGAVVIMEESLEMTGILIFLKGILTYIDKHLLSKYSPVFYRDGRKEAVGIKKELMVMQETSNTL